MASSTSNLDLISSSQASKEVTANALFDASSVSTLFGRRASTTAALTFGFYGGALRNNGTVSQIANGTVALTANLTNYVEATGAGVVSANTTAFTAGSTPLYSIVAGASTITSYIDYRVPEVPAGWLSKSVAAGGTITLTQAESVCTLFEFTGVLPNNTTVVFPARGAKMQIDNITTGAFTLTVKTAAGLGVVLPQGKTMNLYCNNTDIEESNSAKEDKSAKNAANGYCPLDAGSKVPLANLPAAVAGAMTYIGTWNASTNTPTLAGGTGTKGYFYKVSTSGTQDLGNGATLFTANDAVVYNGATWDKLEGGITSAEVVAALGFTPENVANKNAASGYVGKDANSNAAANSLLAGYATTATAAGTTTLTVASAQQQFFTGTTTQTVVMPLLSALVDGQSWKIDNDSTGAVTVNANATDAGTATQLPVVLAGGAYVFVTRTSGTTWDVAGLAADTHAASSKATPVDADELPLADSATSFSLKKLTWANLKTTLGSTFAAFAGSASQAFSASDFNGTIGVTTPKSGAFTTLSASGAIHSGTAISDENLTVNNSSAGFLARLVNTVASNPNGIYYNSTNAIGTGTAFRIDSAGSTLLYLSSTGLAVTGALSASGDLLVGTTGIGYIDTMGFAFSKGSGYNIVTHATGTGSGAAYTYFTYGTSAVGSITQSGTTAVAYNTTSDHRLKTNVRPANALRFLEVDFVDFEWVDGRHDCGVIAHQLQAIYPDLVLGEKDATEVRQVEVAPEIPAVLDEEGVEVIPAIAAITVEQEFPTYQQVNYIGLISRMGAVIQRQQRTLEVMEARLTALEAK